MAIVGTERHLVTGGAGFIGSHIARALLGRGERVTVLDDLSTGNLRRIEGLRGDIRFIEGDVRSRDDVESAMHDAKTVIHQAAVVSVPESVHDPMRCVSVNDVGTLQLLLASKAKGIRRFILAASAAAYGDTPTLPKREEMQPKPRSPYAASKVA
ncbi:MAG: SDR family NAD(P)-dependent oxidoreductase, partial [Myxococcota bacterium]